MFEILVFSSDFFFFTQLFLGKFYQEITAFCDQTKSKLKYQPVYELYKFKNIHNNKNDRADRDNIHNTVSIVCIYY